MSSLNKYRAIFCDIIRSYSISKSSFGELYIKHLNNLDLSDISYYSDLYLEETKSRGISTFDEKLKYLIDNNFWKQEEEDKLKSNKSLLYTYEQNKSNQHLKSRRDTWINEIDKLEKEIKELEYKREYLLGDYAEKFANKKNNELHILYSFYKDRELKSRLFSKDEFNELEGEKLKELYEVFGGYISNFNTEIFKKISLSSFFLNLFYLSPENIYQFYGKPVIELSFYQIELWSWACKFKNDLSNFPHISPEIMSDPDKLIEYVELNGNYKKNFGDKGQDCDAMTIPGATKKDLELLGIKATGNDKLSEELKKKGGRLSMNDLLKMSGE